MIKRLFVTVIIMLATVCGTAGTITNGIWLPNGCGVKPEVPVIEQDSIDAYNKSIKVINDWQQKAIGYNKCLINEANMEISLIANSANNEQAGLNASIEKIQAETAAARARLNKNIPD